MRSWKHRIPLNVRLFGGVVSIILATTNVVWSVLDGDFGNRFWLELLILMLFVGSGIDLVILHSAGARTGTIRLNPLRCIVVDGDR